MIIGQAFQKLLLDYKDEHGLSVNELAGIVKMPKETVKTWLRGSQPRARSTIITVCENLGIDPENILNPNMRYLGVGFTFKTLQARFAERVVIDPRAVYELVILAGATLHTKLLAAGFPLTSTTLPTGQVVMHAANNLQLGKAMVSLQWNQSAIILVVALPGQPPLLSEPLSEDTFKRAVEILSQ